MAREVPFEVDARLIGMVLVVAGAVAGSLAAAAAYGIAARGSQWLSQSVYRGPGARKSIALTFDDGPSESTPILLNYLEKHGVAATFFECGMNARRLPSIAREVVAAGHQLGNHTWSHPHLPMRSPASIHREFADTQHLLIAETGAEPVVLRPPYGLRSIGLRRVQRKLDLLEVQWTVIGNDWKLTAARITERVLRLASPGGIVCLHDGRGVQVQPDVAPMLAAIREIVPALRDEGYSFETVSELLRPDAPLEALGGQGKPRPHKE
jgi:peptidoglycan/xylan/chitin deacetylase (PgdA/CDA1 family)